MRKATSDKKYAIKRLGVGLSAAFHATIEDLKAAMYLVEFPDHLNKVESELGLRLAISLMDGAVLEIHPQEEIQNWANAHRVMLCSVRSNGEKLL
jgi:hypothetical protein